MFLKKSKKNLLTLITSLAVCCPINHSFSSDNFSKNSLEIGFGELSRQELEPITGIQKEFDFNYSQYSLDYKRDFGKKGSYSGLIGVHYSDICDGFGDYFLGLSLGIRKEFRNFDKKIIPYFQFNLGRVITDANKTSSINLPCYGPGNKFYEWDQTYIEKRDNFLLGPCLGVKFNISNKSYFIFEGKWDHISNAGVSSKNHGLDLAGARVKFGKSF